MVAAGRAVTSLDFEEDPKGMPHSELCRMPRKLPPDEHSPL